MSRETRGEQPSDHKRKRPTEEVSSDSDEELTKKLDLPRKEVRAPDKGKGHDINMIRL